MKMIRPIQAVASLLAIGVISLPLAAEAQNSAWTAPVEPFRIADNLYYVGTAGLSAFLLTSNAGHILIDAPLEENVPRILDNIRALGFSPSDIRVLLVSHAHFDHVGGAARMIEATGASLAVSEADAPFIRDGRNFGLQGNAYRAAVVSRTFRHLETIRVGGVELTAHVTPGHTPGCTTWSGSTSIAGERFPFVSVCSLSVLGNYRIAGDAQTFPGQGAAYCRSLAHLRTLEPDIFLGAHGSWFLLEDKLAALRKGNSRAFVEQERYRIYLNESERSIERALAEQGHQGGCAALTMGSASAQGLSVPAGVTDSSSRSWASSARRPTYRSPAEFAQLSPP